MNFKVLSLMTLFACAAQAQSIQPQNDWSAITTQDLTALYQQVRENVPLEQLAKTTSYQKRLEEKYANAKQMAQSVTNRDGYVYTLRYFGYGLRDFHTQYDAVFEYPYYFQYEQTPLDYEWAGFFVSLRDSQSGMNDKYVVTYRDQSGVWNDSLLPDIGSELMSCEDINHQQYTPEELLKQNVLPYYYGSTQYRSTWKTIIPYLFLQMGHNPSAIHITQCTFKNYKGEMNTYPLNWEKLSTDNKSAMFFMMDYVAHGQSFGISPKPSVSDFGKGQGVWISIPSFDSDYPGIKNFIAQLTKDLPSYRSKKVIVFDMRGNSGGSLQYEQSVILSLYGVPYLKSLGESFFWNADPTLEVRVSPQNIAFFKEISRGETGHAMELEIYQQLQAAAEGQDHIDYHMHVLPDDVKPDAENPVKGKVFVLTDGWNESADLWFTRNLLEIPSVTQIGKSTGVFDATGYCWSYLLNDKMGGMCIPPLVIKSPSTDLNKPFVPQGKYYYHGYLGNTPMLKSWVIGLLNTAPENQ